MRSTSCGSGVPWVSCWPTSMWSPSPTSRRERLLTGYSCTSEPSSGVTRTLRALSVSSISIRPAASEIGRLALGLPRLEELDHAGQTLRDVVRGRHTTGVEGTHRQLRAGLTDGLRGDDADRLTDVDQLAGGQRAAVALRAGAGLGVTGQHGADLDRLEAGSDETLDLDVAQVGTGTASTSPVSGWVMSVAALRAYAEVSAFSSLRTTPSSPRTPMTFGMPRSVPQSSSRMITSCETSTRRRVR